VFAELLRHQSLKMTMRYAHLSPAFLTAEVSVLDSPAPKTAGTRGDQQKEEKGNMPIRAIGRRPKCPILFGKIGSPHWTISATG
jgi:hypothetical protein